MLKLSIGLKDHLNVRTCSMTCFNFAYGPFLSGVIRMIEPTIRRAAQEASAFQIKDGPFVSGTHVRNWEDDPVVYDAVVKAVTTLLDGLRPAAPLPAPGEETIGPPLGKRCANKPVEPGRRKQRSTCDVGFIGRLSGGSARSSRRKSCRILGRSQTFAHHTYGAPHIKIDGQRHKGTNQ